MIAALDLVTTLLFLCAGVLAASTRRLRKRSPLWAGTSAVFLLYAVKYGMNFLEWGWPERFGGLDVVDDYFSMTALAILVGLGGYFWSLAHRASEDREKGR